MIITVAVLSFSIGFFLGITKGIYIVYPIVTQSIKETYSKVYNQAVSDTLERLKNGNHKKNN